MLPSLGQTVKKEIFSIKPFIFILVISIIYFSFSILLLNYKLVLITISGNYPIVYKINLLYELIMGAFTALTQLDLGLSIITSILFGINMLLIVKIIKKLEDQKRKLHLTIGGSALLGIAAAGCSSCGFSVLSLLGLTGAISFIPFQGLGLHVIAILLLIISIIYSLKTYHTKVVCKIN